MALWVRGVFERFGILMQDELAVRWPLHPHRVRYINDAMKALALHKPSATTQTRILWLQSGSRQQIPDAANQVMRVIRNVANGNNDEVIGKHAVTPVSRIDMDLHVPDWSDPSVFPPQKRVDHVIYDEDNPRQFYVWPPNNGQGRVEAAISRIPDEVETPAAGADNLSSYSFSVDVDGIYMTAIVHWMAHMAYSMDAQISPDAAARSQAHLAAFANELGVKLSNEMRISPNRPAPRPETPLNG